MRIVETDNYCRDYPDERFACPYSFSYEEAARVADLFNDLMTSETSPRFWKVVRDDYVLDSLK